MKFIGFWIIKIVAVAVLYISFGLLIHWQFGDKWLEQFTIMTLASMCGVGIHNLMSIKMPK